MLTHSMGGLVAPWTSQQAGAKDSILGVIHCVQPVTGATAAYWRIKSGFEGFLSPILGDSAFTVTPILGNIPGGLQLFPNKLHLANDGSKAWLRVTGGLSFSLPVANPYDEIYRVKVAVTIRTTGKTNCDVVRYQVESNWIQTKVYDVHQFRGLYLDANSKNMQAVLQDPDGGGDGTVPTGSAGVLNDSGRPSPGDGDFSVEHQKAYENSDVQAHAVKAILALVKKRYYSMRQGDFPEQSSGTAAG